MQAKVETMTGFQAKQAYATWLLGLVERFGLPLILAGWLLYRDYVFVRKLEAFIDAVTPLIKAGING